MKSAIQTATRLSRRAALLMLLQTLVACSATRHTGTGPEAVATARPAAGEVGAEVRAQAVSPTEIPFWPVIDVQTYRLQVTGLVAAPISLTCETLQSLPRTQADRVLICMGEAFLDKAIWSGVALDRVLDLADPQTGATTIKLVAADQYERSIPLEEAPSYVLAMERAGEPLSSKHGFPVRAVAATDEGWKWVRWLVEIRVS
jgi:DMSO/TMAO reductase YedYZ molybdopterin-dependent catalytic subunit